MLALTRCHFLLRSSPDGFALSAPSCWPETQQQIAQKPLDTSSRLSLSSKTTQQMTVAIQTCVHVNTLTYSLKYPVLLQVYPMDERQWLLGTAYNTGIECLQ